VPDLIRLGVASFKIEGRLKSPEYVAAITRVYRQAVDRVFLGNSSCIVAGLAEAGPESVPPATSPFPSGAKPLSQLRLQWILVRTQPPNDRRWNPPFWPDFHREHDYTMEMAFSRGPPIPAGSARHEQPGTAARDSGTKRGVFLGEGPHGVDF